MRTVLIGDIGGQIEVLESLLHRLGIGPDLVIPEGLTLIQVGDVVRMVDSPNLDSYRCVELVDKLLRRNPGRWVQLLGNHESPLIGGPYPPQWIDREAMTTCRATVQSWWNEKLVKLAVLFMMPDGSECVLTHAGITRGYLGLTGRTKPLDLVQHLNSLVGTGYGSVARTGIIGFGDDPSFEADFMWASSSRELIPSWESVDMGFHQIHGHDTPLLSWDEPVLREVLPEGWSSEINTPERLLTVSTPEGWTFRTNDWVLKETYRPQTSTWGLIELDSSPIF